MIFKFIATGFYIFGIITFIVPGIGYICTKRFKSYHSKALEKDWADLDTNTQLLIVTFLHIMGAGWLSTAAAMLFILLIPFLRNELWADFALLVIGAIMGITSFVATMIVRQRTSGKPPVTIIGVGVAAIFAASLISMIFR